MCPSLYGYLTTRSLERDDAPELSRMLQSQSPIYVRFFTPFSFDEVTLRRLLSERDRDMWMGFYWQKELVGFFMLRGWDEGYEAPAYGVLIAEPFSGYGLTTLSLTMAKTICRLRGAPRIMLKVHPGNFSAKSLFERAKFIQTGIDPGSGNLIYHFDVNK